MAGFIAALPRGFLILKSLGFGTTEQGAEKVKGRLEILRWHSLGG
jgi:hypothetical protein